MAWPVRQEMRTTIATVALALTIVTLGFAPAAVAEEQRVDVDGEAGPDGATVTISAEGDIANEEETITVP